MPAPRGEGAPGPRLRPRPPAPPRPARQGIAGGTGGVGAPTGRARCSARVSGCRCAESSAGCPRPPSGTPVTAGAQVTEGGPRRGRRGSPRTQLRGRTRAPRGRAAAPRAGLGKFPPDGWARGGGQGSRVPRRPPPASCCGEPGPRRGGRRGRTGSPRNGLSFALSLSPCQPSEPAIPSAPPSPGESSLEGTAELAMSQGCLLVCFPPPRARCTRGHRAEPAALGSRGPFGRC